MICEAVKLAHPATREDLEALPEGLRGELIDGVLYAMSRPRGVHQVVTGRIYADLSLGFERGRGGPGGWWVVTEPGIELPGAAEVAPDVAAWRRERLPALPGDHAIAVVPDWVCEVLSPTTRRHDQIVKRRLYARAGVPWLWMADPEVRVLTVSRLEAGHWVEVGVYGDETDVPLPPFDAVRTNVKDWWPDAA